MLQIVLENVADSFRAPRRAARRVIDTVKRPEEVAMMFGLSFCISTILMLLTHLIFGIGGGTGSLGFVLTNLMVSAFAFGMLTVFVYMVGRLFGGEAEILEVAAVIAWHSLVTAVFTPLIAGAVNPADAQPGPGFLIQFALVGVVLWLLVNFIAEAHRFQNAWRVAGVMFVGIFLAGLILPFLLSGLI